MKLVIIAIAIIIGSVILHLTALWMERKGWIYYKHNKPSGSRLGTAFLEIQSILEPDKKHMIELKSEMKKAVEESGDEPGDANKNEAKNEKSIN
jgi:hypothetical protein